MMTPFRIGVPGAQGGPPVPQMPSYVQFRPNLRPRFPAKPQNSLPEENLLFVGNIDDRVPNDLLHAIMESCGPVEKWQRMQGPDGRLPAFGFVAFKDVTAAILAVKALNDFRIGNKSLNVKPDEKARQFMYEHIRRERALQNLPRKRIGTELDVEEVDKEEVASAQNRAIQVIRETHAHLLIERSDEAEENKEKPEQSRSPRAEKDRKRRKRSRERQSRQRSTSAERKKKRRRSSSSDSSASSVPTPARRSPTPGQESDASDVVHEKKQRKREQKRREEDYLRQLKKFEERERRMAKQFSKEDEEDLAKQKNISKEAKKLAQFLEDYNDEKDDQKYYRSSSLLKRRKEYDHEREMDRIDREEEAKELAALKEMVITRENKSNGSDEHTADSEAKGSPSVNVDNGDEQYKYTFTEDKKEKSAASTPSTSQNGQDKKVVTSIQQKVISNVISVFGEEDPDDDTHVIKKKIKKFEITQQDRMENMTAEERRQMVKELINDIPTDKDALFACEIEWSIVDSGLVKERIEPWVQKKIKEYIGDDEPTLVKFICDKVLEHGEPARLLGDLAMILDEEAEAFVVKLWRLIVFQSRAKKLGLNVSSTRA